MTRDESQVEHMFGCCIKKMGKSCRIAAGCSNTNADGVSLYTFPKQQKLRVEWKKQVQRTRVGWSGPTKYSVICSCHFTEDSFEQPTALTSKMGYNFKRTLKETAVPTVFNRPLSDSYDSYIPCKKKNMSAFEKRQNKEVSHYCHYQNIQ